MCRGGGWVGGGKLPTDKANFAPCFKTMAVCDTASSCTLILKDYFNEMKDSACVRKVSKINESIQSASGNRMVICLEASTYIYTSK